MKSVEYLVVGAGISGLSFANWIREAAEKRGTPPPELEIIEADSEPGGYCKTIEQDGFVWDYSGHFFHFRHPDIEAWLRARMPGQDVRTVEKQSFIRFAGQNIDFPFQKNIHQLPRAEFIDCLVDLYFRDEAAAADPSATKPKSFREMLYRRYGKSIAELFLVPYNEKLYACDLDTLDAEAMGRFFPDADIADIIRNMRTADNASYNASFTYPVGGAIQYVHALLADVPESMISYETRLESVDLDANIATTNRGKIAFRYLVSSAPLNRLLDMCNVVYERSAFSWNKVLVFNLGFDQKGAEGIHWMYFPDRQRSFYRVGWYDNIIGGERMSLYVEIGARAGESLDVAGAKRRVLADLEAEGIISGHSLVSWHSVVLDPAYVHINQTARAETARTAKILSNRGVWSVGRYGGWTYCSIEDNMLETRELAEKLVSR